MKKISVVAPFYNEIDTIEEFINQVNSVMSGFTDNWELLLIDDGSNDGGYDLINPLIRDNQNLRLVKLEKNLGPKSQM